MELPVAGHIMWSLCRAQDAGVVPAHVFCIHARERAVRAVHIANTKCAGAQDRSVDDRLLRVESAEMRDPKTARLSARQAPQAP